MFKPKTYKRNDLEVYRLIDAGGEELFYNGVVNVNSDSLFSDTQGRIYYLAIGVLDPDKSYYVEVMPVSAPIPMVPELKKEKDIVGLLVSSPRDSVDMPEEAFKAATEVKHEIDVAPDTMEAASGPVVEEEAYIEPAVEEDAERVIHEPFIDKLLKENLEAEDAETEAETPVEPVMEPLEPMPEKRKRGIPIPLIAAALIVVIFIAIAGVYVVKPDMLMGGISSPTITPTVTATPFPSPTATPTATPTPVPTATPTATPIPTVKPSVTVSPTQQPSGMTNEDMLKVSALISITDPGIKASAQETVSPAALSANNKVWIGCDLYDFLDDNWAIESSDPTPEAAPVVIDSLEGTDMEYSALYCSLAGSLGVETRVIIVLDGPRAYYYPEFKLASSIADRDAAFTFIQNRYHSATPAGHQSGNDFWISMVPGGYPGITITGTSEYAITPGGAITKIK